MKYSLLNKGEIENVLTILSNEYTDLKCGLDFSSPFELLLSLILAAQCTDKRVNIIRPELTNRYPTPESIAKLNIKDIYSIVKSCSFPNNKSKHILEASKMLVDSYQGNVPNTMESLIRIPGIGRKSANIILSECFGNPVGIAVDTHVKRTSKRIGLTNNIDPNKIEKDLTSKIPYSMWGNINHMLVTHGRNVCVARKPKCNECPIKLYCREYKIIAAKKKV